MGEVILFGLLMAALLCWFVVWDVIKWIGKHMGYRVTAEPVPGRGQPPLVSPEQVLQLRLAVEELIDSAQPILHGEGAGGIVLSGQHCAVEAKQLATLSVLCGDPSWEFHRSARADQNLTGSTP